MLHGQMDFQTKPEQVSREAEVVSASKRPRVHIAGRVFEQTIVGRWVGKRIAHKVGRFPEPPESILRLRAKRLKQVIRERGFSGRLARMFATH